MKYETKEAKLILVKVKPISNITDKRLYKDLLEYKKHLVIATRDNNEQQIVLFKQEINRRRMNLRKSRPQTYIWRVFVKKYKKELKLEIQYDKDNLSFKDFIKKVIDEAKHEIRLLNKAPPIPRLWGKKWSFQTQGSKEKGFVFTQDGSVLKAHVQKNMKLLLDGKVPTMPRRYIGIELEFCAPIKEEQFALKLFQNGIHKYAQLKADGSLRPKEDLKERGFELAILLEESNYKKGLKKITDLLASIKAVAKDRRCGLHVHVDMRRRNKDLVYNNMVACQFALLSIVDPSRYNNEFCRTVSDRKFPTEFTGDRQERYKTINAAAYYKYRTLEIRMHEGSVDYKEITNWVDLLLKLTNYSKRLKDDVTKLPVLNNRLKLKKKLYNYALERSCVFQIQANPNIRHMREDIAELRRPHRIVPIEQAPRPIGQLGRIFDENAAVAAVARMDDALVARPMFDLHPAQAEFNAFLHDMAQESLDEPAEIEDDVN